MFGKQQKNLLNNENNLKIACLLAKETNSCNKTNEKHVYYDHVK